MNYLLELRAFHDRLESGGLSAPAIALWYAVMHVANRSGWKRELPIAASALALHAGLSPSGVKRAREALRQAGLLSWRTRGGNRASVYTLISATAAYGRGEEAGRSQRDEHQFEINPDDDSEHQFDPQGGPHAGRISKQDGTVQDRTRPPVSPQGEEGFAAFWEAYPRKAGKAAALRAWARLRPDAPLREQILRAVAEQRRCEQWTKQNGQYIPYPATWLSRGQWEDEASLKEAGPAHHNPFMEIVREMEGQA